MFYPHRGAWNQQNPPTGSIPTGRDKNKRMVDAAGERGADGMWGGEDWKQISCGGECGMGAWGNKGMWGGEWGHGNVVEM